MRFSEVFLGSVSNLTLVRITAALAACGVAVGTTGRAGANLRPAAKQHHPQG
jgi:hypothetical protein